MALFNRLGFVGIIVGATIGYNSACFGMKTVFMTSGNETEPTKSDAGKFLYDFRQVSSLDNWRESSDTVRRPGMSKGAFVLQKTQLFQRAVMFSLLNPQPNGAGFVSFYTEDKLDLSQFSGVELRIRGQGENSVYKVMFKHKGQSLDDGSNSYQAFFEIPLKEWSTVKLPFGDFKAYYRGRIQPDAEPLDLERITIIGLQIVGGVYSEFKQSGASSLEIDYIKAY